MRRRFQKAAASLLIIAMTFSCLGNAVTTVAADAEGHSQTIDGTDRKHGISQIQTVIPDPVFAGAVYDALKRENHWGDGTATVKEVLSSCDGYVDYTGERIDSIGQSTGTLKDEDQLVHDITGIEWLRNMRSVNLSYNKISDLTPLNIDHISSLAEENGETDPAVVNGEKWFRTEGENLCFDFRGNPVRKYPAQTAGRLEWLGLESSYFPITAEPYCLIKEDVADRGYEADFAIPPILRDGGRISLAEDGCRISENDITGSAITGYTNKTVSIRGLAYSGTIKMILKSAANSSISSWKVDEWDLSTIVSSTLQFEYEQPVRIYNPVRLASSQTNTVIAVKATEEADPEKGLAGAVFHLYKADVTEGSYVPRERYNQMDYVTGKDGRIQIREELPDGDYCLVQEAAPEGYLQDKTPYGFHVGGTVSLTGGSSEITPSQKTEAADPAADTYIDRYSPDVAVAVTPAAGNTVAKVLLTYFDRTKQGYEEKEFAGDDIAAVSRWINENKGDKEGPGQIDGSVSLKAEFQREWELNVPQKAAQVPETPDKGTTDPDDPSPDDPSPGKPSDPPSGQPSGQPADKPSDKTTAENPVSKGTKITSGKFVYKVTKTAAKKKTGMVTLTAVTTAGRKAGKLTVPAVITAKGSKYKVTKLASSSFRGVKAKCVVLSKNIKAIPKGAFAKCKKLSSLTVEAKLKSVKKGAFTGCKKRIKVKGGKKKARMANIKKLKRSGYRKFK